MRSLPLDIRPQWLNVVRRLQSVARIGNEGFAILSITILVDKEGVPVVWTEPKRTKVEPKTASEDWLDVLLAR